MRIVVTGAAGMLGRAVVNAVREAGHEPIALARADLDVVDAPAVEATLTAARPGAVVNCAAYTDVDGAESEPERAEAVNGAGAGNVARAAAAVGAGLVHVSSDYVFDGEKRAPYFEDDATAPLSAYGRSKLSGEREAAAAGATTAVVRSSWLFGADGRNFVDTMLRLARERERVEVVDDQVGCPTWTGHLAPALVALAAGGAEGTFHVAGAGACSWHGLAVEAFRQAALECRVEPTTSDRFPRPARRPAYSVLASGRRDAPRLPPWQDGLAGYLRERLREEAPA
jgi:dTDP-4-dehydrorhamnose reductase